MRRRLLPLVLVSLMLTSSMASVLGASGREVVDNWDDGDAWVEISLISWVANQTEEWDSSDGLPDPQFRICFDVDGEDLDCVNTPTWENQWELNATWNYTIDIPDTSNLLNITIECEDNDAFNDDECDMNADVNEWKLYAEYNWSQNPNMTISGNGDGDGNGTWKNAASVWEVKVFGFGDEDGDGVPDNIDSCPNTTESLGNVNQSVFPGCSWGQLDTDIDGFSNEIDLNPFNSYQGKSASNFIENIGDWQEVDWTTIYTSGSAERYLSNLQLMNYSGTPHAVLTTGLVDLSGTGNFVPFSDFVCGNFEVEDNCTPYANEWLGGEKRLIDFDGDGDIDLISAREVYEAVDGKFWNSGDHAPSCSEPNGIHWKDLNFDGINQPFCIIHSGTLESDCKQTHDFKYQSSNERWILVCIRENTETSGFDAFLDQYSPTGDLVSSNIIVNTHMDNGIINHILVDIDGSGNLALLYGDNPAKICTYITSTLDAMSNSCFDVDWESPWGYVNPFEDIFRHDFDGDGDLDIGLEQGIIELTETGVDHFRMLSSWVAGEDILGTTYADIDSDGDYDFVVAASYYNGVQIRVRYNPAYADSDGDLIPDSDDLCPETSIVADVDVNGCSDLQRDSDLDGVNDASDQCPNTVVGVPVDTNGCFSGQLDSDGDGISDAMDLCPTTPAGESTNLEGCSQSEVDSDADGVVNSNDACPGTTQGSVVDANGCSESDVVDNDADGDGVVDTYDACPSTIVGSTVDQNGCSDAQLDIDGDGVANTRDQCPGTSSGAEVSYYGCSASQGDEDLDGVLNVDDDCPGSWFVDKDNPPETSNGCDGMLESQDDDEDGDGLVDTYDECPNTPGGQSVDDQGCTASQRNTLADDASSEGDTGDAIVGMFCCFGLLWLVFSASTKSRKKPSSPPRYVQAPPQVIHQQSVQQQQQVMRELENQRRQAEHQVAQLQQQLHQSNQMSAAQLASVQSQLTDMQQQVTATNMAKAEMQRELEQMKIQEVERNTLTESPVNIQDSAVAGDSLIGSTKIENQTVNDADAIARAAAAAAIDAYRMGLDDRER